MNTEKIRSGGVYCDQCKICISAPRIRKNFQPESFIICHVCEIKDPFRRAIAIMNRNLGTKERQAFNKFRNDLWYLADHLRDLSHSACLRGDIRAKLGDELMNKVCQIPILEK